jgi:alpha-tubulin suppressor-like RCC1 family protein
MAAAGGFHSVVASAEGDVFTWGAAENERLGHNDEQDWQMVGHLGE